MTTPTLPSASLTVNAYAPRVAPVITAHCSRTAVVGRQGVVFWVDCTDKTKLRDITVSWDMKDYYDFRSFAALEADITADEYALVLRATGDKEAGRYRGLVVGHCFSTDGSYTPTATVRDRTGVIATLTLPTITRSNLDAAYPGTATVCYSRTADFTGAPSGAELITVSDGVWSRGRGASNDKRILMKSGETFLMGGSDFQRAQNSYISTFGGETPAKIATSRYLSGFQNDTAAENNTIDFIDWDNGYDPTDLTQTQWWLQDPVPSEPQDGIFDVSLDALASQKFTLSRVTLRGCHKALYMRAQQSVMSDVFITDYFDYGVFSGGDYSGYVGVIVKQNNDAPNVAMDAGGVGLPDNRGAWNTTVEGTVATALAAHDYFGPDGECPNWPRHAPIRHRPLDYWGASKCVFWNTLPGWSGHPQPAMRGFRPISAETGRPIVASLSDTAFRGGFNVLTLTETTNLADANAIVVDGCVFIAVAGSWRFLDILQGGIRIRNSLCILPATTTIDSAQSFFSLWGGATLNENLGGGVEFDGITFALLGNLSARTVGGSATLSTGNITARNVLIIDASTAAGVITVPAGAVMVEGTTGFINLVPDAGNAAIVGRAREPAPALDAAGHVRAKPAALGAFEP